tara:strand:- start:172 stop:1749 length:1578 start_codon:yes stop_codon:yes gene_type:complete
MALDGIDLNVDNYSQEDLLSLLSLNDDDPVSYDDIISTSNPLINRYTKEDNYDLANFFQQVQNKLLEDIDYDENHNIQDSGTSQLGNIWQNENISQDGTDPNQANKVTDRKQKVEIFNQDDHFVMNRNQLGVNNNYQLPVAQGQMNPNLKNTTSRLMNIDSQYREDISPFLPDPDGSTSPTNYTLNLSDPIRNAISINMTAYQIPYTWYLIDSDWRGNNCFHITDNSSTDIYTIDISSGNYNQYQLTGAIQTSITNSSPDISNIDISYNSISGKTEITNNNSVSITLTFYDSTGKLKCNSTCKTSSKFNSNLGWILGFRGNTSVLNTDSLYGEMIYTIEPGKKIISEAFIDIFGPKYFLLVVDDFQQNHLNRGLVSITPTKKYAEIPSYWNADLAISANSCATSEAITGKKTPTYVQNAPRRLTQAQLFTLNSTTQSRSQTTQKRLTAPTNTNVLALIPLRDVNRVSPGRMIIDNFNLSDAERVYFGPVDLERMRVRLVDDQGYTVNLNGNNWSFTMSATTLYQY